MNQEKGTVGKKEREGPVLGGGVRVFLYIRSKHRILFDPISSNNQTGHSTFSLYIFPLFIHSFIQIHFQNYF